MKPLVVRADASTARGTGHVMRCLALAQAWQDAGGRVVFVMADEVSGLSTRLKSEDISIESIAAVAGSEDDARQTSECAGRVGADWIVVDGYQFSGRYQQRVKDTGHRLLVLDDYGHADHYWADVVVNQNLGARVSLY